MKARAIGESEQAARWRAWSAVEPPKAAEGRDSAPTAAGIKRECAGVFQPAQFFDIFFYQQRRRFPQPVELFSIGLELNIINIIGKLGFSSFR